MDCRILTDFAGIAALEQEWTRLWDQSSRPEIFNSFEYVSAWWSVHGPSYQIFTPVVFDGEAVIAILPLVVRDGVLHFFCFTDADFFDLLCEARLARQVVVSITAELNKHRSRWKWAVLDNVPQDSALLHLPSWAGSSGLRAHLQAMNSCPTLNLRSGREESFERLLGGKRSRQEERRLQRVGDVSFTHLRSVDAIRAALPAFFRQHTDRWAVEGTRGRFTNEISRRFYAAMVDRLCPNGTLRFSVLRAGDKDVAYHLGFELRGRMLFFKPTFDVDYWEYSPGKVLLQRLLQYAKDTGLEEFDFSIGDEDYKKKFANEIRTNYRVVLTHDGLLSRIHHIRALLDSALRSMVGEEHIARFRVWRESVFSPGWARRLLASMRMSATPATYLISPRSNFRNDQGLELQPATLSWLAQTALDARGFISLSDLRTARDWIKDGWRFVYISSKAGSAGGWFKNDLGMIAVRGARTTSHHALRHFLVAVEAKAAATGQAAVVSLQS